MKLHLSKSLRAAILATFAVVAPLSLSLATATAADAVSYDSPRTPVWDKNWDSWGGEAYKPLDPNNSSSLQELSVRRVEGSGCGMNILGGDFYKYTVTLTDDSAAGNQGGDAVTYEVTAYAMAMNGVPGSSSKSPNYNSAAGGYALAQPVGAAQKYSVFMDISGTFEAVAGGDIYGSSVRDWGGYDLDAQRYLDSNRFISIREGAKVGVVSAFNLTRGNGGIQSVLRGDSYISIYSSGIGDSVVGRTIGDSAVCTGDSHVFVYSVLNKSEVADVHIGSGPAGTVEVMWSSKDVPQSLEGCVVGGSYNASSVQITGNSWVEVDLGKTVASAATFRKTLAGGSSDVYTHNQVGDAAVYVKNSKGASLFSAPLAGQSVGVGSSSWTGNSAVIIQNGSTNFSAIVAGANYRDITSQMDVRMWQQGDSTFALAPAFEYLSESLSKLKNSYTELRNTNWPTGDGATGDGTGTATPAKNVTCVYVDKLSSSASFSMAVVGSNAVYLTSQSNPPDDSHSNETPTTDANMWLNPAQGATQPAAFTLMRSLSFLRERNSQSTVWIEAGSYKGRVVAGDYLYDTDSVVGVYHPPTNDYYSEHYSFRSSIGSTYVHTDGGTFRSVVQGGTYVYAQNYGGRYKTDTTEVKLRIGDINMELSGGTFDNPKGIAVMGGFDVTDTMTTINGGNYLTSNLDAAVDSIYIQMGELDDKGRPVGTGVTVNGEIIGGSRIQSCIALNNNPGGYAIRHGSIWLRLLNGRFNGDVYGAGFYDTENGKYETVTAPLSTDSVNIEVSNKAEFGKIAVTGSYKMSINQHTGGTSRSVVGTKMLSFTSAGVYNNLSGVEFSDFNVVDVTNPAGYVTMDQTLQKLFDGVSGCRKIGEGTLALTNTHSSNSSYFVVENGTLVLAANSNNFETGLVLGELSVHKGATLDISAGSCGTRGSVRFEGDSSLKVSVSQSPTLVKSVALGGANDGKVNIISNSIRNGAYNIRLFDGLSVSNVTVFGQSLKPLSELGLSEAEVGDLLALTDAGQLKDVYAIRAENYVSLIAGGKEAAMDNAYLVLYDGVLSLATHIGREITWKGGTGVDGDSWNYVNPMFTVGEKKESCNFHDADTVNFVAGDGETMTVRLDPDNSDHGNLDVDVSDNKTLAPHSVIVGAKPVDGEESGDVACSTVIFQAEDEPCLLDVDGAIVVRSHSMLEIAAAVGLVTHADTSSIEVDKGSALFINGDKKVGVYNLGNSGTVSLAGSMTVTGSAASEGTLSVGGDLTLEPGVKSARFGDLTVVGDMSFAEASSVTISGYAAIGSANGGTLVINKGEAASSADRPATFSLAPLADTAADGVTLNRTSTLKALQGPGSLELAGEGQTLTLKEASTIGNLSAGKNDVKLYNSLHVGEKLLADSVTFASVGVNRIIGDNVTADKLDCNNFSLPDTAVKDIHFACDGDVYTLVEGKTLLADLKVNEKTEDDIRNGRFNYHAYVDGDTIKLGVKNVSPDYYADRATTENGKAGAASLDSLFSPEIMSRIAPDNALASVIVAMDNMAESGGADADKLAAAAAGASNAALGCAFSDDVHRQLKAIRNRTTTMGCAECETHEDIPTFNAWINAEGNYHKLDSDGTFAGYTLSSWGGTVGADVDFSGHLTVGLAVSALYGDYSADGPDTVEGDLDTQYLTLFARYAARAWVHTFVATFGRADVSVERTVSADGVAYSNEADTDGTGFGFMYEVGRVFAVNEDSSACIEPVVNFTLLKSTIGGFTETGTDAIVRTDDLEMTRFIIGAGARMQGVVGETVYNRTSILEGRALLKANLGDNSCEAKNNFVIGGIGGTYESAEQGSVGLEIGIGITIPVGGEGSSVFADFSADINSGYSNINGTVGYRVNF